MKFSGRRISTAPSSIGRGVYELLYAEGRTGLNGSNGSLRFPGVYGAALEVAVGRYPWDAGRCWPKVAG